MVRNEEVSKGKVFSEFFTNLAVATLSAGIVVPIFTLSVLSFSMIVLSFTTAIVLLASAIMTKDLK
ncbi:hypothetical protein COX04_01455 [Candidatus Woesebacteria bacterium CG22_combo_CG10-13_8_21_14_all_45_10]|uniref:Uncharacterized protein n=1 Tax=Candidatus Woesebacteria bacterium CG22_combo_CG10-13_8_21_14_all_45_10 TaxID=1975060 RepID=A0A2H0BHD8_9BACT|nr:MAG: hypothetical protein COX04_01455 [Candidatus Woesebacteria bacterium CG22_combo_CG10-13_8_21_14_all_45_10]